MRASAARVVPWSLALASLVVPAAADAAPCGQPDVDATFPPHEARGVPPNATLSAHYSNPADYIDEIVTLAGPAGGVVVSVSYDEAESMLRAQPVAELAQGSYVLAWPALRGVATSRGLGRTIEFSVGTTRDASAPRFSGLRSIEWDLSREEDPCTESLEDRFLYDLGLGSAEDDLPADLLALVVFETRSGGKAQRSAPEQIAVVPWPEKGVVRVGRQATGDETVCFAAVTRDLTHRVSGGGNEEVCVETTAPPFFYGCTSAPVRTRVGAIFVVAALALAALRRRKARRG
jgi:hypothetical protein